METPRKDNNLPLDEIFSAVCLRLVFGQWVRVRTPALDSISEYYITHVAHGRKSSTQTTWKTTEYSEKPSARTHTATATHTESECI